MCSNTMLVLETDKHTTSAPNVTMHTVYCTRMAPTYFDQLSDFIIPVTQLRLVETVGQGITEHVNAIVV